MYITCVIPLKLQIIFGIIMLWVHIPITPCTAHNERQHNILNGRGSGDEGAHPAPCEEFQMNMMRNVCELLSGASSSSSLLSLVSWLYFHLFVCTLYEVDRYDDSESFRAGHAVRGWSDKATVCIGCGPYSLHAV